MLLIRCYKKRYTSWLWGGQENFSLLFTSTPSSSENVYCYLFATSAKWWQLTPSWFKHPKQDMYISCTACSLIYNSSKCFCFMKLWTKLQKNLLCFAALAGRFHSLVKCPQKKKEREKKQLYMWEQYCCESICASQTTVEQQVILCCASMWWKMFRVKGEQQLRARPEDGRSAVLQDSSAAGEGSLCITLLLTHCINSADVPSPEISQHKYLEDGGDSVLWSCISKRWGSKFREGSRIVSKIVKLFAAGSGFILEMQLMTHTGDQ